MGLSASLGNALSGMNTSQSALNVLSRNVANAGTPGYHRQALSVVDTQGTNSVYARAGGVQRAFSAGLQAAYNSAVADTGYTSTLSDTMDQLQTLFGKPGDAGSLDTVYGQFENALQSLGTSPDDFATRATVVTKAQSIVATLHSLSGSIQQLRQGTETEMQGTVNALNQSISALAKINDRLADQTGDEASRSALMDQRDRLVATISEQVDVQAQYRNDGTVALMTRTGVGVLDVKPSTFVFQPAGTITADKQFSYTSAESQVGSLKLISSSGLAIDLVQQNVLQSGKLKALVDLRDKILTGAQSQLDVIAAGLAKSLSTETTPGTAASSGSQNGFSIDIAGVRDGNDVTVSFTSGGVAQKVKLMRVDDPTKLPLDYLDADGTRVIGADYSSGAAGLIQPLRAALGPGFSVSASGTTLTVLDDGAASTTDVTGFESHVTATALQNGDLALNVFNDINDKDYTGSISGVGQQQGFAARIQVNTSLLADNKFLVQYEPGGSMGDDNRANYLLDQLSTMRFATPQTNTSALGAFRLGGPTSGLIAQTMDNIGSAAGEAQNDANMQQTTMDSINQRLDGEYGVNVDDEMSRLLELQNAYAANARIISAIQQLLNRLIDM